MGNIVFKVYVAITWVYSGHDLQENDQVRHISPGMSALLWQVNILGPFGTI